MPSPRNETDRNSNESLPEVHKKETEPDSDSDESFIPMDGRMIAPELKDSKPLNMHVDLDQQKSYSAMKIRRGFGPSRKSVA